MAKKKFDVITELYEEALAEVTRTPENWKAFLRSACRNYRLPFDEQLLVYVQRPDAVAVLTMEDWNKRFGRWVKRDSKGIAVFDKSSAAMKLKYYFDVSDTQEGRYHMLVRPVPLWEVQGQYRDEVRRTLANAFGVEDEGADFAHTIVQAAKNATTDNLADYMDDIWSAREESPLEDMDYWDAEDWTSRILSGSTAYMVMERCGIEPGEHLTDEVFKGLSDYHSPRLANLLGVATSDIAEMMLVQISDTVRKLQKKEKRQDRTFAEERAGEYNRLVPSNTLTERGNDYEDNRVQQAGRLFSAESGRAGGKGNLHWEVRIKPKGISKEPQVRDLSRPDDAGQAERTPEGDAGGGTAQDGADYKGDGGGAGRDRGTERARSHEVGGDDEQHPAVGGGERDGGTDLRIEGEPTGSQEEQRARAEDGDTEPQEEQRTQPEGRDTEPQEERRVQPEDGDSEPQEGQKTRLVSGESELQEELGAWAEGGDTEPQERQRVWPEGRDTEPQEEQKARSEGGDTEPQEEQKARSEDEESEPQAQSRELSTIGRQVPETQGEDREEELDDAEQELEWYDRSSEDKDIPFFHEDEEIKSLLLSSPYLKESREQIADFFDANMGSKARREYIQSIFNNELTELTLEDGTEAGYKTFQNVLHLWKGRHDSPDSQAFYSWDVIVNYFEGMRLMGELRDRAKPLGTLQGQLNILQNLAGEKHPAFSFPQEIIDYALQRGSSFKNGKFRIYSFFVQGHTLPERVAFLKDEYGSGGFSPILAGTGIEEKYDSKGLKLRRRKDNTEILLTWSKVAKRIAELIAAGRYMSKGEIKALPEYEKQMLAAEIYLFYYDQPEWVVRPYPHPVEDSEGVKAVRPQLDDPERVKVIIRGMEEVLANTPYLDQNYVSMQKAYRDLCGYRDGTYSLFTPLSAEQDRLPMAVSMAGESAKTEQGESTAQEDWNGAGESSGQNLPDMNLPYDIHEDTVVTIGIREYTIDFLSNERVILRDMEFPLFTEEYSREELDRRMRENPANDHLQIREPIEETSPKTAETDKRGQTENGEPEQEKEAPFERGEPEQTAEPRQRTGQEVTATEELPAAKAESPEPPAEKEETGPLAVPNHKEEQQAEPPEPQGSQEEPVPAEPPTSQAEAAEPEPQEEQAEPESQEEQAEPAESPQYEPEPEDGLHPQPSAAHGQPKHPRRLQSFDLHPEIAKELRSQYKITDDALGQGTPKEKFRANMDAIYTLKKCEAEDRYATPQEQEILARYVGWGGLSDAFDELKNAWAGEYKELRAALTDEEYAVARRSTLTAFYTPPVVIRAMYQVLVEMGLQSGNILEPSCAVGNFIGMKPDALADCRIYGVEIDSISGRIAGQLYQNSTIAVQGFEEAQLPDSFFDVAIGNVPFGQFKVSDKRYDKHNFLIHDFFFAKTLDKVRPGGVIAFITSSGTMDKKNPAIRKYIAQRAELLGAIRLPNDTFKKNAGTDVTADILFLQKRDRAIEAEPDWLYLDTDENGITMNSFFVSHPEMILGEMVMETTQYGMDSTCRPYEDRELSGLLKEAVGNIHADIGEYEPEEDVWEEDLTIPAAPGVTNFSFTVHDGKIYYRENSRMKPVELSKTGESRVRGMIAIRDCVRMLIEYQTEGYSEGEIEGQQKELNELYDTFTRKYGLLNQRANSMIFSDDNSYPLLCSLEILHEDGTLKRKADMFTKRTIRPHELVTSVQTASEALSLSLSEKARVDMDYMCSLTGRSEEEIEEELSGVIFRLPDIAGAEPHFVSEDEYLSGNVREKLHKARLAAGGNAIYQRNVEALERVQPKDLSPAEISVRIGAIWIPASDIEDFIFELLDTPFYKRGRIGVRYSKYTGEWKVDGRSEDRGNVRANSTYGTHRASAYRIIEDSLNLRDTRIYDSVEDADGRLKSVLNKKETAIAQGKQDLIKQAFVDWIWKDAERRERLVSYYNEHFNAIRPREYDGSHLHFYGINPEITLNKHQINGVARIIYGGNTLLAYVVGAGKTFTMVAAAMESKRLGLCSKSMVVVPNHIIEQFAAEWLQLYPAANIMVATKKDFEKKNRRKFCARIATSDVDAVIIGHSQFQKIPISAERQKRMLQQQIEEIVEGIDEAKREDGGRLTVKQLEKKRKELSEKLHKLNDQSRKDDVVTFEELGVDRLFVDEADQFKNRAKRCRTRTV